MSQPAPFTRRLRLRLVVFVFVLLSGAIPLAISNVVMIRQNRELLETEQMSYLTGSAQSLSREVGEYLGGMKRQLHQLGTGLLAVPGPAALGERLRQPWVTDYLQRFGLGNPNLVALRVLDREGAGPRFAPPDLPADLSDALDGAFAAAQGGGGSAYRFAVLEETNEPVAVLAVPIAGDAGETALIVEAVLRLRLVEAVFEREARGRVEVFLIDRDGKLLWSEGADEPTRASVAASDLVRDFANKPLHLTAAYPVRAATGRVDMLGQVSPVEESGWGVVVQKPAATAFEAARKMVISAVLASLLLLLLAALLALLISRWLGEPVRRLIRSTHEIASGNFGARLEERRMVAELADLSGDFNRMSEHVEEHVSRLRAAAQRNRELFISSIRAFAAAIDAKDPYTRGHSERVAELSRGIARHLGQSEEFLQRLWIGALLHDVGKIGIEDRVLRKGGVLTAEEFDQMKRHPVVGGEILQPIVELHEMLPAIKWHHENWNGRGYPDGLRGEEIPLMARIVAVADCFDAITTDRPYQKGYEARYAAEVITKLAGSRFDAKVVTAFLRAFEVGDLAVGPSDSILAAQLEAELPAAANT
jgi:HD-GYP domain-containing protein (c-di-GMP phosphodiesterase class II)